MTVHSSTQSHLTEHKHILNRVKVEEVDSSSARTEGGEVAWHVDVCAWHWGATLRGAGAQREDNRLYAHRDPTPRQRNGH
jgi:hypothetical protein